jgi:hypothetical protein
MLWIGLAEDDGHWYLCSLVVESSYALNSVHDSAWDIKTFVETSGDMHNSHRLHYHFFP